MREKTRIKKNLKKEKHWISVLAKLEGIQLIESVDKSLNLLLGNCGLECDQSIDQLLELLSTFGRIEKLILLPKKPYALVRFSAETEAENARKGVLNERIFGCFVSDSVFLSVLEKNQLSTEEYCKLFRCLPEGLILIKDFLAEEDEKRLLSFCEKVFENEENSRLKNRLVKHFGYRFDYSLNKIITNEPKIEEIPQLFHPFLQKLFHQKVISEIPDQLTVNYYFPGNGIPNHRDSHSLCGKEIISISVGSDAVMIFKNPSNSEQSNVFLPKRSVMIMTNESRYVWTHAIPSVKSDVILSVDSSGEKSLTLSRRQTRISFTFRKVLENDECFCRFKSFCQQKISKENNSKEELNFDDLEEKYVHSVYESIADHFSQTRYKPWPKVKHFLQSLPDGSLVLDIGCGNGKYLSVNEKIAIIGCDRSQQLLSICRERRFETFVCDCLQLSQIREHAFDACICVAVVHHLFSWERRVKALQSMIDLLVSNGTLLVTVWAFEQTKDGKNSRYLRKETNEENQSLTEHEICVHQNGTQFQKQDLLVPWVQSGGPTSLRYYHVFKEGELEALIRELNGSQLEHCFYDSGNWCAIIRKTPFIS